MNGREIERKWLAQGVPDSVVSTGGQVIAQGYLAVVTDGASKGTEVRLRSKGGRFSLTVKSGGDLVRQEKEVEISQKQFAELWECTQGARIEKTRYELPWNGITIELDVYSGVHSGLVVAEVEFDSEVDAEQFEPPPWFGSDVTDIEMYKNKNLAKWNL
jgi:CYTH domain-containing protein